MSPECHGFVRCNHPTCCCCCCCCCWLTHPPVSRAGSPIVPIYFYFFASLVFSSLHPLFDFFFSFSCFGLQTDRSQQAYGHPGSHPRAHVSTRNLPVRLSARYLQGLQGGTIICRITITNTTGLIYFVEQQNGLTYFPPLTGGCLEGLDAFRFFFKHRKQWSFFFIYIFYQPRQ